MTEGQQPPDRIPDVAAGPPERALETRILRGAGWVAVGFGTRQITSWLSMLVLVRLLEPEAFGIAALALVIVSALQYLRGSGIFAALVYHRTSIDEAAASAFVYLMISSVLVYALCIVFAPVIAWAFGVPELTDVLRVLTVVIVLGSLDVVPVAILERELNYSAIARIDLGVAVVQPIAAVSLAFAGAGVWSIVGGHVAAAVYGAIAIWHVTTWRPSLRLASWSSMRELFGYGRFAGATNIATFLSGIVDTVVVGRVLGATAVGFYSVAFRVANVPESIIGYLMVKTMFPAFSMVRADRAAVRRIFLQHAQRVVLLVLPGTIFVALAAEPICLTLLGADWSSVVTPVRILAVFAFVKVLSATAGAVFRGDGRPELAMWFAAANVLLLVPALMVLTRAYDLNGAAVAVLCCGIATTLPALVMMMGLIGLPGRAVARTLRRSLLVSVVVTLTLAVLVPATSSVRPVVSLIVLLAGAGIAYCTSVALFARSVVAPMWFDLRGTRTGV